MSNDPERNRAAYRKWYARNRAEAIERSRNVKVARRSRDPLGYLAARIAQDANRRAIRWEQPGRLTASDVLAMFAQQPNCVACGDGQGMDHVLAFAAGGTNAPDNIQNLCGRCNDRKGDGTVRLRDDRGRFAVVAR